MTTKIGAPRNASTSARVGPVGATTQPAVVGLTEELKAVRRELVSTKLERDDYRQEMFESNRYAAWLTHQSRDVSVIAPGQMQSNGTDLSGDVTGVYGYMTYLEERLWAGETDRLQNAQYIRYLEGLCWELETRRLAGSDAAAPRRQ